eukprot:CAMPEP_0196802376 /NCGR_PEP_ID=MMETSP1362-20130617/1989_1 /TAXON_ID=163516 /ORGANISM="Leptocylindrus danicus, Strain CCMP1856" /LENGTH=686 /DNA_ID=CAMNT_0042173651 /DNA_START=18 /DNA_END=2078 /DNA_ORIENTATION=+
MTITRGVLLRATTQALRPQMPRYHQSSLKLHTAVLQKSILPLPCSCRYEKISVTSSLLQQLRFHSAEPAPIIASEKLEEFVPPSFSALNHLHPNSLRALHKMLGQDATASEIQARTLKAASCEEGIDVLGRARTGTGKTLAFLLPTIETLLKSDDWPREKIGAVILSPTRELALQICEQANQLLREHNRSLKPAIVMFGGNSKVNDFKALERNIPSILVATPGRLKDHLNSDAFIRNKGSIRDLFSHTKVLVLDETDRLLDMGFRDDVLNIISYLPKKEDRQTLLFSATVPPALSDIMDSTMKPGYATVDCITDSDISTNTNAQVVQTHVIAPQTRIVQSVMEIVLHAMKERDHKIVVFFPTSMMVKFYSELFNKCLNIKVIEMHSKKNQSYRTRSSDYFRRRRKAVMFTSDVSARGVDYPDVTHVIQYGLADSTETYVHRLGRTGRAGKLGKGWLILSPLEEPFLNELSTVANVDVDEELSELLNNPAPDDVQDKLDYALSRVDDGSDRDLTESAKMAYKSLIGFHKSHIHRLHRNQDVLPKMIEFANKFAKQSGLQQLPYFTENMAQKLGLLHVPGVNIKRERGDNFGHNERRGYDRGYGGRSNKYGGYSGRFSGGDDRGERSYNYGNGRDNDYRRGGGGYGRSKSAPPTRSRYNRDDDYGYDRGALSRDRRYPNSSSSDDSDW